MYLHTATLSWSAGSFCSFLKNSNTSCFFTWNINSLPGRVIAFYIQSFWAFWVSWKLCVLLVWRPSDQSSPSRTPGGQKKGHQERNSSPILAAGLHTLVAVSQLVSTTGNIQLVCKDEGWTLAQRKHVWHCMTKTGRGSIAAVLLQLCLHQQHHQ